MKQSVDYELTPDDKDDVWNIRIMTGEFIETVFQFGAVSVTEDGENMSYSLTLVSSPDEDLTVDNTEFQDYCGKILISLLEDSITRLENEETTIERQYDEDF